ncbi:MAG: nucleoside phosphorylase [Candidatus Eiseniibacteriota bacterium]
MSAPNADPPQAATLHRIGIVVGLVREAEALAPALRALSSIDRPLLFCSGGSVERARFGVERMIEDGVAGLLSFGMAGGLDPALKAGDLLVADRIVAAADGASHAGDAAWAAALVAPRDEAPGCPECRLAVLAGVDEPVVTVEAKRRLAERTGAVAVDMESHVVAEAAARHGLPFIALRAIADPAGRTIPSAALAGLAPDGGTRPLAVMARLALRPWQIPAVMRLAADSAAALGALRGVALRDARRLLRLPGMDLAHELFDVP